MAKKSPPEAPVVGPAKRRIVGKRISRHEVIEQTINYPASIRPMDIFKAIPREEQLVNFEKKTLAPIEEWAKEVIRAAGCPMVIRAAGRASVEVNGEVTELEVNGQPTVIKINGRPIKIEVRDQGTTINDGQRELFFASVRAAIIDFDGRLTNPDEEHISTRWYAGAILKVLNDYWITVDRGNWRSAVINAYRLGSIVQEQEDISILDEESTSGDQGRKVDPVIRRFVELQVKNNQNIKFKELLAMIPTASYAPKEIGRAKLFRDGNRIVVSEKRVERDISIFSLSRYLTRAKEKLSNR